MSDLHFTVGARTISESELRANAALQKAPAPAKKKASLRRTKDSDKATHSAGFQVLGYTPTLWAELPDMYAEAVKKHEKDAKNKHPGTLDEFIASYVLKNKPKKVRSKPYELRDAADICARLAEKAGWQRVRVEEVLKVEA